METKVCSKCKIEKTLLEFRKTKSSKDGHHYSCKACDKIYRTKTKEHIVEWSRDYYLKNRDRIICNSGKYTISRRQKDSMYRLISNLRHRVYMIAKGQYKTGSAIRDLGCSADEFKSYIESKFQSGMTWENYGSYWHIDHIIPLSKIDLTDREQFLKACHYINLQPLEAKENIRKSNRYDF